MRSEQDTVAGRRREHEQPQKAAQHGGHAAQTIAALREAHVPTVGRDARTIIVGRLEGTSMEVLARDLSMATSTAYRHKERVLTIAFARAVVARTPELDGVWCALHLGCCLHDTARYAPGSRE